jgi:hypothetical protein
MPKTVKTVDIKVLPRVLVVNSTKTLELIQIFLKFFRSLYAPVSDHVTPALILAELPLQ